MDWIRALIRFVATFLALYLLGYVVPGFSGLTVSLLVVAGLLVALVAALVELVALRPGAARKRALMLFIVSGSVIYLFSMAVVGRPPVASAVLAAFLVVAADLLYPAPVRKEKEGMLE